LDVIDEQNNHKTGKKESLALTNDKNKVLRAAEICDALSVVPIAKMVGKLTTLFAILANSLSLARYSSG
jgi:hypothetical protein